MKKITKILSVLMAAIMLMTALCVPASAESIEDTAKKITSGKTYSCTFADYTEEYDYKIVVKKKGTISVKIDSSTCYNGLCLYDSDFNKVKITDASVKTGTAEDGGIGYYKVIYYWNKTGEKIVSTTKWNVDKGTYYLRVDNWNGMTGIWGLSGSGKTKVTATFPSSSSSSSSAKISYLSMEIPKGSKMQLAAVVTEKTNQSVKWSSSKSSVVSVNSKGKITAKKKGAAVITAKLGSSTMKIRIKVV